MHVSLLGLCMVAARFENIHVPPSHVETYIAKTKNDGMCQFEAIIKHISYISSRDNGKRLYALVDPEIYDGSTVDCCPWCFNKCTIFSQVEKMMSDYVFRHTGVANLSLLQKREGEYLACRGNDGDLLIVVNRNTVTSVDNQILLACAFPTHGRATYMFKLFECADMLRDPNEALVPCILDLRLSGMLLEDVSTDGWWPLRSLGIGMLIMAYYASGTVLVLIYYGLRAKEHD